MHFERLKCQAAIDLDKLLLVTGKEVRAFNARANPVYLLQVSNVHILNAHTVAVDVSSGRVRNIQKPFANSQCDWSSVCYVVEANSNGLTLLTLSRVSPQAATNALQAIEVAPTGVHCMFHPLGPGRALRC